MLSKKEKEEFEFKIKSLKNKQETFSSEKEYSDSRKPLLQYTHLGFEFLAIFLAGIFGGRFLDAKFDTSPYLMLVGVILGFALGLYKLIVTAKKIS